MCNKTKWREEKVLNIPRESPSQHQDQERQGIGCNFWSNSASSVHNNTARLVDLGGPQKVFFFFYSSVSRLKCVIVVMAKNLTVPRHPSCYKCRSIQHHWGHYQPVDGASLTVPSVGHSQMLPSSFYSESQRDNQKCCSRANEHLERAKWRQLHFFW